MDKIKTLNYKSVTTFIAELQRRREEVSGDSLTLKKNNHLGILFAHNCNFKHGCSLSEFHNGQVKGMYRLLPKICNWAKYQNRHSSKSISVTKLSFF